MPSISSTDAMWIGARWVLAVAAVVMLAACSRPAPDLPPDYGSVDAQNTLSAEDFIASDLQMSCTQITDEQDAISAEAQQMTGVIDADRGHNEAVAILGSLFILPALAAEQNPEEKRRLDDIQARWDTLVMLKRYKGCPSATQ